MESNNTFEFRKMFKNEIDDFNKLGKQIDSHTDSFTKIFESFPKEAVVELYNIQADVENLPVKIYSKAESEIFKPIIDSKENEHFSYDDEFYVMKEDGTFFSGNAETILNRFVDINNLKEFVIENCRENVPILLIIRRYSGWADEFDRLMEEWENTSRIPLTACLADMIMKKMK